MVLNTFALTSLFVGVVSLLLIVAAALSALIFHCQLKRCEGADERALAESRIQLSFLLISTALLLRLTSWPLFYILLQSLIPLVPGAMCIFGVTRVMPAFVAFLQTLKPIAFFLMGGWLILYRLDLSLKTHSLMNRSIRLLVWVSAVALVDAAAEILFILVFSPPGAAVSCCTAVADIVVPSVPLLPLPLLGARYHHLLMAGYHGFSLGLVGLIGFLIWGKRGKGDGVFPRRWLVFVALVAALSGVIAYAAFGEYLGPRLMGLPDHHCLYCLLQYRPVSIIILGLLILGSFLAVWPLLLSLAVISGEAKERLPLVTRNLLRWAFFCLLASWVMAAALA